EQVAVLFGFRLYDLEDEFFLAEAVIARQIQLPGDLVQLLQRFAFKLGHFQAASPLHISWPRERDCETDDTDADAGHQLPCFWASRQSRRKRSNPLSVSGCWIMRCNTPKGMVATWAPAKAAWVTWSGWRMLAASTCVSILCKSKICTHWATTSMPSWLMSSRRPTKGLTKAAPARAANRAWLAEKIKVTLTSTPWAARAAVASRPAGVAGTLMTTLSAISARIRPSSTISRAPVLVTSALMGPFTSRAMAAMRSWRSARSRAMRVGLVVTPARTPHDRAVSISSRLALSRNIFKKESSCCPSAGPKFSNRRESCSLFLYGRW